MAEKVKASEQEIQEALALLTKVKAQRAKQRERFKNNPELQAKAKERGTKKRIEHNLLVKKAVAAGITVSPAEIQKEMARLAALRT